MDKRGVEYARKRGVLFLAAVLFMVPSGAGAQQESSSDRSEQQQQAATGSTSREVNVDYSNAGGTQGTAPSRPPVLQLWGSGLLRESASRLRFGSLYVSSMDYFQVYDDFDGGRSGTKQIRRTSLFRADVVYDRSFRRSRFTVQYQPRLAVSNGQVVDNFTDHSVLFDTYYRVTPRLTLSIHDGLVYFHSRNQIDDFYLNSQTPGSLASLQRDFLDSPGYLFSNSTEVSIAYQLSPRNSLEIRPNFSYARHTGSSNRLFGSNEYGNTVSLRHTLSERKTVGLFYSVSYLTILDNPKGNMYHTFGGSYTHQMSPTLGMNVSVGASATNLRSNSREWTTYSSVNLVKAFHRSALALTYSRDINLAGFATNRYSDRADASYGFPLGRRARASLGVGYYRTPDSGGVWGKYATSQFAYYLTPTISLAANFARKIQSGDGRQVISGTHNFLYFGIHWEPRLLRR